MVARLVCRHFHIILYYSFSSLSRHYFIISALHSPAVSLLSLNLLLQSGVYSIQNPRTKCIIVTPSVRPVEFHTRIFLSWLVRPQQQSPEEALRLFFSFLGSDLGQTWKGLKSAAVSSDLQIAGCASASQRLRCFLTAGSTSWEKVEGYYVAVLRIRHPRVICASSIALPEVSPACVRWFSGSPPSSPQPKIRENAKIPPRR